jgi:hypothetical protein
VSDEYRPAVVVEEQRIMSMESPPRQPLPQSTVQLVAQTSDALIGGLGKSPLMLGVITLNLIGIASAVFFLNLLIQGQQKHLAALLEVQNRQQTEIVTLHKAEFDALLEMANRLATAPAPLAPGSPILTQPIQPPPSLPPRR